MARNNWFCEKLLPGESDYPRIMYKIKRKVFSGKSPYQKIEVFDVYRFGRILVLDGIIQLGQFDEFIYHEMISHLPLFYHPNPQKVLIIGGGDGGTLREVLKHPLRGAYLVDIDRKVIEISQKYLSFVSNRAFRDKRSKIFFEDGIKFVKKYKNYFDVIIIDSTDPGGPSLPLFGASFYRNVCRALKENGIMIAQSGSFLEQFSQIKKIVQRLKNSFAFIKMHRAAIPTYGWAEFSLILASKKINLDKANFKKIKARYKKSNLKTKYYSPEIHFASGVLPKIYQICR